MDKNKQENDDLIKSLTEKLTPVKPLRCHYIRSLIFLFFTYALIFASISLFGVRSDIDLIFENHSLLVQLVLLMIAGLTATFATFKLTLPSEKISVLTWAMIITPVLLVGGVLAFCATMGTADDLISFYSHDLLIARLRRVVLISIIPTIFIIYMIRKGRPIHGSLIGLTSFMAITALSVAGCRLSCSIDSLYANLLWHYLPIAILSLFGFLIGRYLYKW